MYADHTGDPSGRWRHAGDFHHRVHELEQRDLAVHRVPHAWERLIVNRLAGGGDQLAYTLCLQVRGGAQEVSSILIDVAKVVRVQHRTFDALQHPRVIATRVNGTFPECAAP